MYLGSKSYLVTVLTILLFAGIIIAPANAYPYGVSGVSLGCVCHSGSMTQSVIITLEEVPENYSAGDEVILTLNVSGGPNITNSSENIGGFNLRVSGGTLSAVNNTAVQILNGEATHTEQGNDQLSWQIKWVAPQDDSKKISFVATGNAVNGDGDADHEDKWNQIELISTGVSYDEESDLPGFTLVPLLLLLIGVALHSRTRYP